MRSGALRFVLLLVAACIMFPAAAPCQTNQAEIKEYKELADRIIARIGALKGKVPGFEAVDKDKHLEVSTDPFQYAFSYEHAISKRYYDPDQSRYAKIQRVITEYNEGGFSVQLWLELAQKGRDQSHAFCTIGKLVCILYVDGPGASTAHDAIGTILNDEARLFSDRHKK